MSKTRSRIVLTLAVVLLGAGGCYGWADVTGADDGEGASSNSSSAGTDSNSGGSGGSEDPHDRTNPAVGEEAAIGYGGLKRLSTREYDRTLRTLFGGDLSFRTTDLPDPNPAPFDNDFVKQFPSLSLIEGVDEVAQRVSARVVGQMQEDAEFRDFVLGCGRAPEGADDRACFESFLEEFGVRAMRRPLADEMRERYIEEFFELRSLEQLDDSELEAEIETIGFYDKVEYALQAMLQSGGFVYRREFGEPVQGDGDVYRLDDWAMASRLSYFIWGTMPDAELFEAARSGELSTEEQVRRQAERMMEDRRAVEMAATFHAMWLGFYDFYSGRSDAGFDDDALVRDARAETRKLLERVIFEEEVDWRTILTSERTWLTDRLADHYGLPRPDGGSAGWVRYPDDSIRGGILSHASFLTLGASKTRTSIIQRSEYVLDHLACSPLPPPGDDVKDNEPDTEPPECKGEHLDWLTMRPPCITCHATLNAPGMGLENFDGLGRHRTHEPNEEAECEIEGVGRFLERRDGEWRPNHEFEGPGGLGELMAGPMESGRCMVRHLYEFAMGHEVTASDKPAVERLTETFQESGYDYRELVVELAASSEFRFRIDLPVQENRNQSSANTNDE